MKRFSGLAVLIGAACSPAVPVKVEAMPSVVVLNGSTMGTRYVVKCEVGHDAAKALQVAVDQRLMRVNETFSTYQQLSEISRFNRARTTEPIGVTEEFCQLVARAMRIAAATHGAFDPTIYPLIKLYGFERKQRRIPSAEEIAAVKPSIGWKRLEVLGENRLRKRSVDVEIDLSGMAKGYGVDVVIALLRAAGVKSAMVEIGGEVRCMGRKLDESVWAIGIETPPPASQRGQASAQGLQGYRERVELLDQALATSGDYRNVARGDHVNVHHIFDPKAAANPEHRVRSVSVRAGDCALADALATAFMVRGPIDCEEVLDQLGDPSVAVLFQVEQSSPAGELMLTRVRW